MKTQMITKGGLRLALMGGVCLFTVSPLHHAMAQTAAGPAPAPNATNGQEIVITGSRTITNGNNSPTPVTVVTVEQLQATVPSDVPDALEELPVFSNSSSQRNTQNATQNMSGNYLNLRGFGVNRTLILQDGVRVGPTTQAGVVDTNTLPQMLLQRVDVVTGGASAVYGSDAVTGVVNFVTDNHFNGLKLTAQGGDSSRNDDGSWRFGIAGGKEFLDGRLHVEGSYEHYSDDGIANALDRPAGQTRACVEGNGTTIPYKLYYTCGYNNSSFGGEIISGPLNGYEFATNGVLTPLTGGTPTPGASTVLANVTGDNGWNAETTALASLHSDQAFGRLDYDFTDHVRGFVDMNYAKSANENNFTSIQILSQTISAADPYLQPALALLTPAQQSAVAAAGTFTFSRYGDDGIIQVVRSNVQNTTIRAGLDGDLARFKWNLVYSHATSDSQFISYNNINNAHLAAALDAVTVTSANVGTSGLALGSIACNVSLTNPGLYPGCTPLNPFGPTAEGKNGFNYIVGTTVSNLHQPMDDASGSISGPVFDDWAGPIVVAVNGEVRKLSMSTDSNAPPLARIDCTGLRYNCTTVNPAVPGSGTALYYNGSVAPVVADETVSEVAFETTVPLLKDLPFARDLSMNGAVRYTDYAASSAQYAAKADFTALTWKVGGDWHVNDELTFRATRSRDIRAPNLNDLYAAAQPSRTNFLDVHTATNNLLLSQTQGNPNLVPEVADTTTAGVVFRPAWLPGFSASVDYFDIDIANAIGSVSSTNADQLCEQSGGASAAYCGQIIRPLPFSNTTAANFPTLVITESLNTAKAWTSGIDIELNYGFNVADLLRAGSGKVALRLLATYQPVDDSIALPGQPTFTSAGTAVGVPAEKLVFEAGYTVDRWQFNLQTRWRSSLKWTNNPVLVYAIPDVPSVAFTDFTVSRQIKIHGSDGQLFLTIDNIFDTQAPLYTNGNLSFSYPALSGDDIIGRYFTAGLRLKF